MMATSISSGAQSSVTAGQDGNISSVAKTNPRGIPAAPFIDNVSEYIGITTGAVSPDELSSGVETAMRRFQELISKYQFMETTTARRLAGLKSKLPDIQNTVEMVEFIKSKRSSTSLPSDSIETTFSLHDTLYARASVRPDDCDDVFLWLGANVMVAYPIEDAISLLHSKLSAAQSSITVCNEDLDYLREQITTLEVAIARVYNWDVIRRRTSAEKGESTVGS